MTDLAYDIAFERMRALADAMTASDGQRNEAATRLQLIDQLLFDCLGWNRQDADVEDHENGEYADYVLDRRGRLLIVEAKKEGAAFTLPDGLPRVARLNALYALGGAVEYALTQVEHYAQTRGTPYAAISNGHQLVAFVASRQDGTPPRNGRALVFESPRALLEDFATLWETLSARAISTRRLTRLLSAGAAAPPPKLSEAIADYPGVEPTDERLFMLSTLRVLFLPDYVRDDEDEVTFLVECYCPPGAYSRLSMLSRSVLRTRYSTALGQELRVGLEQAKSKDGLTRSLLDEVAATSAGRDPIVLLGNVGVGKTMFLRKLLRVDARDVSESAIMLYVNLGESAVLDDIRSYVVASLKAQLLNRYSVDVDEADFLRATYHAEVRRFARGINGPLARTNPTEFALREIDHLVALASQSEEHLRRSLEHLVKLRRHQIIIVLDNVDQRGQEDQESTFVIAAAMAKHWPCTVFVTLRPETFNASRVNRTLSAYQVRAFTVEPPRVERVAIRRLEFGDRHYAQEGRLPTWLGYTAESDDLRAYLRIMIKSFKRSERLRETLINLSGGNTRRALELLTTFVESPHAEPYDVLRRNRGRRTDYLIPHHVFLRAVLLGDAAHYDPGASRIPNLFDISTSEGREHFLLPCLLGLLRRASEHHDSEGYISMEDLIATFQDAGFSVDQIDFALRRGLNGDFLEKLPPDADPRALRLTSAGAYAHRSLAASFQYCDAIVVDTPVADPEVRARLRVVRAVRQRLERAEHFLGYLDEKWQASGLDELGLFDWPSARASVRAEMAYIQERL